MKRIRMRKFARRVVMALLVLSALQLAGCNANVGVGLNVGVPIGDHGYMSLGTGRWY